MGLVVAVIGATGVVGKKMLQVLQERNFPIERLIPVASAASSGKEVSFRGEGLRVRAVEETLTEKPDLVLMSAGSNVSKAWAPRFVEMGSIVIDNSSAWRMDNSTPLVVPEVNMEAVSSEHKLIANPNCSTIQLMLVLHPLSKVYGIERVVLSTYQSVTGTGAAAVKQLLDERAGNKVEGVYPHPIDLNCLPHGGDFLENGYTSEEMKLVNESRKILGLADLKLTATVVRVPVFGGHSESVNIELKQEFELTDLKALLTKQDGVVVQDDPSQNLYPMPLFAEDKDDVFVGRIRRDRSTNKAIDLWVVSDNLRKGAATNAVQIAEEVLRRQMLS